jgi:hypothetical protein
MIAIVDVGDIIVDVDDIVDVYTNLCFGGLLRLLGQCTG